MHVSAIVAAGGRGARFGSRHFKQLAMLGGRPVLQHSVEAFLACAGIADVVVALPGELASSPPTYLTNRNKPIEVVTGGERRQDSVANAFAAVAARADLVVVHDAARPLVTPDVIVRTIAAASESGAAIAAVRAHDTVKQGRGGFVTATLPRDEIFMAQTPQAFRTTVLREALALRDDVTDEAMLAERAGYPVRLVEGDPMNLKITTRADLELAERLIDARGRAAASIRIGNGYDLHRLVPGRPLVLGGVTIPFDRGPDAHSDGDAVCHAVTDAVLGACGAGDIGRHFPDDDPAWSNANSLDLLRRAIGLVRQRGFSVSNVDVVVIAQRPKLAPHIPEMIERLAGALGVPATQVSVKGKTNEGVDSMGTGASIAVHAVALVEARTDGDMAR